MRIFSRRAVAVTALWTLVISTLLIFATKALAGATIAAEITDAPPGSWQHVIIKMRANAPTTALAKNLAEKKQHLNNLRATANASQASVLAELQQAEKQGKARQINPLFVVNAVTATVTKEVVLEIAKVRGVAAISTDKTITADPVKNEAEAKLSGIRARSADKHVPWNLKKIGISEDLQNRYSGQGITVGIIDSGVDVSHPALANKWRGNSGDKATSWFDAVENSAIPVDSTGHGTHVIGTVLGSAINADALLGVAPAANFIAARVFDKNGETTDGRLLAAMQWMLAPIDSKGQAHPELAPRVVNNSWGTTSTDPLLRKALQEWRKAGILPVFSAGNVSEDNSGGEGSITQPASFPETFAVGALRSDNHIAKFSLRGPSATANKPKPDISAPGVNIRSAYKNHTMQLLSGTSMAAPHVTGVAALVLNANPKLSVDQLENVLTKSATPLTDEQNVDTPNNAYGAGKVNAALAIEMAKTQPKVGTVSGTVYVRGKDKTAPQITHIPVHSFYAATKTELTAKVKDDSGVKTVVAKIAGADGKNREIALKLTEGTKLDGTYSVEIGPQTLQNGDKTYQICATDRTGKESCTEPIMFAQKNAVTIGWKENFEDGTDGFEMSGKTPMWQWGKPADGLSKANSGEKVVAVGLDGKGYQGVQDSVLLTPPIALGKTDKAALTFMHWYGLDNYAHATYDTAEVWVGEVKPGTGEITWEKLPQRSYKNSQKQWTREYLDLGAYAGKTIRVMFGVRGAWKSPHKTAGWFIDDLALEKTAHNDVPKVEKDLDIRTYPDGRTLVEFTPISDETITEYRLYRAHDGGKFEQVGTLPRAQVGKYSATFDPDYPKPQKGIYTYYVTAVAGDSESAPSKTLQRTFTKGSEIKGFDFEDGDQGWTSEPDEKGNKFERGVKTLADSQNDGKAPTVAQSKGKNVGDNVFATVLNDYRKPNVTYTLTSPKVDLSGRNMVTLYWQQWFNTRGRVGSDEWSTYNDDIGHIEVSKDGQNWHELLKLDEKAIDADGGKARVKNAWHTDHVEIPTEYLGKDTQVRFVLKTGTEMFEFSGGWYIDDVTFNNTANATIPAPKAVAAADMTPKAAKAPLANVVGGSAGSDVGSAESLKALNVKGLQPVAKLNADRLGGSEDAAPVDSWVPAPAATVTVLGLGSTAIATEPGTGAYSLGSPAGEVTVTVSAPGYLSQSMPATVKDSQSVTLNFKLEKAPDQDVTFVVAGGDGKAWPDAHVSVYEKGKSAPVFVGVTKTIKGAAKATAKLVPGAYTVRVGAPGHESADRSFVVTAGNPVTVNLQLRAFAAGEDEPHWNGKDEVKPDSALTNLAVGRTAAVKLKAAPMDHVVAVRFKVFGGKIPTKFQWSLWEQDDADGLPGRMLLGPLQAQVPAGDGAKWVEVKTPYPVPVTGAYYLSFTQLANPGEGATLGVDSTADGSDHSYKLINGAWDTPDEKGRFLMDTKVAKYEVAVPKPAPAPAPSPDPTPKPIPEPTPAPEPGDGDKPEPGDTDKPGDTNKPGEQDKPGATDQPGDKGKPGGTDQGKGKQPQPPADGNHNQANKPGNGSSTNSAGEHAPQVNQHHKQQQNPRNSAHWNRHGLARTGTEFAGLAALSVLLLLGGAVTVGIFRGRQGEKLKS